MNENRLADYLDHMRQAATDARSFVDGLSKEDFPADKRTQQAVIMSLIVIGEAATKVMDQHAEFVDQHPEVPWRSMRGMRRRRDPLVFGGRYWDRTSGFHRVKVALYR